jgi:hypothetical protein
MKKKISQQAGLPTDYPDYRVVRPIFTKFTSEKMEKPKIIQLPWRWAERRSLSVLESTLQGSRQIAATANAAVTQNTLVRLRLKSRRHTKRNCFDTEFFDTGAVMRCKDKEDGQQAFDVLFNSLLTDVQQDPSDDKAIGKSSRSDCFGKM